MALLCPGLLDCETYHIPLRTYSVRLPKSSGGLSYHTLSSSAIRGEKDATRDIRKLNKIAVLQARRRKKKRPSIVFLQRQCPVLHHHQTSATWQHKSEANLPGAEVQKSAEQTLGIFLGNLVSFTFLQKAWKSNSRHRKTFLQGF